MVELKGHGGVADLRQMTLRLPDRGSQVNCHCKLCPTLPAVQLLTPLFPTACSTRISNEHLVFRQNWPG